MIATGIKFPTGFEYNLYYYCINNEKLRGPSNRDSGVESSRKLLSVPTDQLCRPNRGLYAQLGENSNQAPIGTQRAPLMICR